MKRFALYTLALMLLSACVYPFEVEVQDVGSKLVIDGDMIIGQKSYFTVRYVAGFDEQNQHRAEGTLFVTDKYGSRWDASIVGDKYVVDLSSASSLNEYRLVFEESVSGKTYQSSWQRVMSAPTSGSIRYSKTSNEVVIYADLVGGSGYARSTYSEVWEYTADYVVYYSYNPIGMEIKALMEPDMKYYYCWNSSSSEVAGLGTSEGNSTNRIPELVVKTLPRSHKKFSSLYFIEASIRGIGREEYDYLQNMFRISSDNGSLFSPTPSEIRGNITCLQDSTENVIGYVGASQLMRVSGYIRREDVFIEPDYDLQLFIPQLSEGMTLNDYYYNGYFPIKQDGENYLWGEKRCVDCRLDGGTKDKPDWWPTKHE